MPATGLTSLLGALLALSFRIEHVGLLGLRARRGSASCWVHFSRFDELLLRFIVPTRGLVVALALHRARARPTWFDFRDPAIVRLAIIRRHLALLLLALLVSLLLVSLPLVDGAL